MTAEPGDEPGWVQPSNDAVRNATHELVELVKSHLPQRLYRRDHPWKLYGAAFVARMSDTAGSMTALMAGGYAVDAAILLRALYEQVVIFCWISIDRDGHRTAWASNGRWRLRALHNDALAYGQKVLTPEELAATKDNKPMPGLQDLAAAIDAHWGRRLIGFRPPQTDPGDILTFRGLYVALYRITSRAAHVQPESLESFVDIERGRCVVRPSSHDLSIWWPLSVPLFAQALLVCNEQFGWPNADRVREINNEMYESDRENGDA